MPADPVPRAGHWTDQTSPILLGLALPRHLRARETRPKPLRIQTERLTYPYECEGRFGFGRVEPCLRLSQRPPSSRVAMGRVPEKRHAGVLGVSPALCDSLAAAGRLVERIPAPYARPQ